MLANVDLPEYSDEEFEVPDAVNSYKKPTPIIKKQAPAVVMDDEDRYLEEILSKNYINMKAPPAV